MCQGLSCLAAYKVAHLLVFVYLFYNSTALHPIADCFGLLVYLFAQFQQMKGLGHAVLGQSHWQLSIIVFWHLDARLVALNLLGYVTTTLRTDLLMRSNAC